MRSKSKAFIIDPAIFNKLIGSIDSFIQQNHENVRKVDDWMFDIENELQKIKELLEQRLMDAQTKLANADFELNMCRSMPSYDDEGRPQKPNCSSKESARLKAKRQLDVAQKNLNQMNELLRYAQKFAQEYDSKKQPFMNLLDNKLPSNVSTLHKHHQIMQEYLNINIKK
jgi:hypothetical protein